MSKREPGQASTQSGARADTKRPGAWRLFSIGHSNHPLDRFLALLASHGIELVADVRSFPRSRHVPHFDRARLEAALAEAGIRYVFLGRQLGGRPLAGAYYDDEGHVLYSRIAASAGFRNGLARLVAAAERHRVAVLCSEESPARCHRRLLIGSALRVAGVALAHIRGDGRLQTDDELAGEYRRALAPPRDVQLRLGELCWQETTTLYTIGFVRKSAAEFFGTLRSAGIKRVVDVRLKNNSQLAGFAKRRDLEFFLRELCGAEYVHEPLLAPSQEILDAYRRNRSWDEYARAFADLLAERRVEARLDPTPFSAPTALLCSEPAPERCHRRLAADYLQAAWGDLEIAHL